MMQQKYLFIDRDGTLILEPQDEQIDSIEKLEFMPGVFSALNDFKKAGFKFVMVSNQDGLGTESYSYEDFNKPQQMLLRVLKSQGIEFEAIRICPHFLTDNCNCRKPKIGLLLDYILAQKIDLARSFVIGDRSTDLELAKNINLSGIQIGSSITKNWLDIRELILNSPRKGLVMRKSNETNIFVEVNLDREGDIQIDTGIGFFDHMLEQIAKHAGISLKLAAKGDLITDEHHTIEDTAISLGLAIKKALGDKLGITRYGFILPMDEAQASIALDLSGRSFCKFQCQFNREKVGNLATEMIGHFFRSFSEGLQATIHIEILGENTHHMCEAAFKVLGRALGQAIAKQNKSIPSTKGIL